MNIRTVHLVNIRKKAFVLVFLTALTATTAGYIGFTKNTSVSPAESQKRVALTVACLDKQVGKTYGAESTQEKIDGCLSSAAGQLKTLDEAEQVLEGVATLAATNTVLRSKCHDIYHELGRSAWYVAGAAALIPGRGSCGFGFYHGVMFEAVAQDGDQLNIEPIVTFCESYASTSSDTVSAEWYLCMHGIGHAVTSTTENLQEAEVLCESISTTDRTAVAACFSGALNEELQGQAGKSVQPDAAVQMCNMRNESLVGICFKYTLHYLGIPSDEIIAFCATLPEGSKVKGCWAGVGMRLGSTELFATSSSPGYAVADDPEPVANVINSKCGSTYLQCDTSLLNELAQKVLDLDALSQVCTLLDTPTRQSNCKGIVAQHKPVQLTK